MHLCVFEDDTVEHLLPLVYTRAVYDLRLGIRSQLEVIRDAFGQPPTILHARDLVADVTSVDHQLEVNLLPEDADVLFVNGCWIVEEDASLERIRAAVHEPDARLFTQGGRLVAAWIPRAAPELVENDALTPDLMGDLPAEELPEAVLLSRLWDLQVHIEDALLRDYAEKTGGLFIYERPGVDIQEGAILRAGERVHLGPGSVVRPGAILNAENGPIYIEENVEINEHAVVKGPCYVGTDAVVMTGADIEGCALGPAAKVGGQVNNTVIEALSNKAHAGYLGDAYIGRWCNLGAGTNASNLRNDYAETRMYDAVERAFVPTGHTFLGLVMADHSKSGINTMFNTATVVGVSCNLHGAGFMPRYVPSFTWGRPGEFVEYRLEKALDVGAAVMHRRGRALTAAHRDNLRRVYEQTRGDDLLI